jgi:hypothetical protein
MRRWPKKDPAEQRDYSIDFNPDLGTTTISTASWVIPTGLTLVGSPSHANGIATAILAGGASGAVYECKCTVVTANAQTIVARRRLRVRVH